MSELPIPIATLAVDVPPRATVSNYPVPFASRMAGREKPGDEVAYADDELKLVPVGDGRRRQFVHKDGTPY